MPSTDCIQETERPQLVNNPPPLSVSHLVSPKWHHIIGRRVYRSWLEFHGYNRRLLGVSEWPGDYGEELWAQPMDHDEKIVTYGGTPFAVTSSVRVLYSGGAVCIPLSFSALVWLQDNGRWIAEEAGTRHPSDLFHERLGKDLVADHPAVVAASEPPSYQIEEEAIHIFDLGL